MSRRSSVVGCHVVVVVGLGGLEVVFVGLGGLEVVLMVEGAGVVTPGQKGRTPVSKSGFSGKCLDKIGWGVDKMFGFGLCVKSSIFSSIG